MKNTSHKNIMSLISFCLLFISFSGEIAHEVAIKPYFAPYTVHFDVRSKETWVTPSNPELEIPGIGAIEFVADYNEKSDVLNRDIVSNTLYVIIQDDRQYPRFNEYSINLSEQDFVVVIDSEHPVIGELVYTSSGHMFFDYKGQNFIWHENENGHLWIDASSGYVKEVLFRNNNLAPAPKRIWYGGNIPAFLCRDRVMAGSEEFEHSWPLWKIPICTAYYTERLMDIVPRFAAEQAIYFTGNTMVGMIIGRGVGFGVNVFLLVFCVHQMLHQKSEAYIILFLLLFLWFFIFFLNSFK